MKKVKDKYLLILILAVAVFVRLYGLTSNPPSLNWDEVSHGYNAYSILKSGQDEWGVSWPLIFRAYGDFKLPVYIYTTVPFVWIFGLNAWAVRLPSAIAGILAVYVFYLLIKKVSSNKFLAIFGAFLYALEPWTALVSRAAIEANLANLFVLLGILFFYLSLKGKSVNMLLSLLFFGLSVWTYNTARIFVPLMMVSLFVIYRREILAKYKLSSLTAFFIVAAVFFVPMFLQLLKPQGQARYGLVAIINENALYEIGLLRENSSFSPTITRFLYNRPTYFFPRFIANYFSHFDPRFLFLTGSSHYQFSLPGFGVLTMVHVVSFYLGLVVVVLKRKKWQTVFLVWLALSPLAASVTREAPHALRSLVMAPPAFLFVALGVEKLTSFGKVKKFKTAFMAGYVFICIALVAYYLNYYFNAYRKNYSWSWQYGNQNLVKVLKQNYDYYDKFLITKKYGEPHEFILFYWPWDPSNYREDNNLVRFYKSNWYWVDSFDKFYFLNDWQITEGPQHKFTLESGEEVDCGEPKCLLVTSAGNAPSGWKKTTEIKFLDGEVAYEIYEE